MLLINQCSKGQMIVKLAEYEFIGKEFILIYLV